MPETSFEPVYQELAASPAKGTALNQLPLILPPLELWGGSECTINRVGNGFFDQSMRSGHNVRPSDIERLAGLGLKALRYPMLWETFAGCSDVDALWAWHEERLNRLHHLGVRPILGLVHHGSGPSATNLLAESFSSGLAEHADEAARRFPWVRDWTPVNEPLTTARFAALYGHWYPHIRDEKAFWLSLFNQIDAVCASMAAIRNHIPNARLIQTEDLGHTDSTPEQAGQAEFDNHRRWMTWDLLHGRVTNGHALWEHLNALGFSNRLDRISAAPCTPDVLGLNHYLTSDRFLDHRLERHPPESHGQSSNGPLADVEAVRIAAHAPGLDGALRSTWHRYGAPIAITEAHNGCTREEQMRWISDAWRTSSTLREEGVEIEAVTAWSLFGAHDWDSLLTVNAGHYESGAFDIRGAEPRETAIAPLLRDLAMGRSPDHPVLQGLGWWRREGRLDELSPDLTTRAVRSRNAHPILIVGASGTLGQAFAGACRLRDIDYVLASRDTIELGNAAMIGATLDRERPWAVINCAGWVRVDEAEDNSDACFATNTAGCVALAHACMQRDIHYSCFSSDLIFDGAAGRSYVESDVAKPLNIYGESKARAEAGVLAAGARSLVIRTASFFSPYDTHNFAVHLVASLRAGRPFRAVGDCITSPTYVPDLVRATLDLIIDDEIGLWHLTSEGAVSWSQFARDIAEAMDLPTRLIATVRLDDMKWPARRPRHTSMTSERGLIMPTLETAIERFAATLA